MSCSGGGEIFRVDEIGRQVLVVDIRFASVSKVGDRFFDSVGTVREGIVRESSGSRNVLEFGN